MKTINPKLQSHRGITPQDLLGALARVRYASLVKLEKEFESMQNEQKAIDKNRVDAEWSVVNER